MPRIREFLIEETTRHGSTRFLFHRRPNGRRITIKGQPGEKEFEDNYQWLSNGGDILLDREKASIERRRAGTTPHTVAELSSMYFHFVDREVQRKALSTYTVETYGRFIQRFTKEYGSACISSVETHHLEQILDQWSATANAWNNALRAIKHMFAYAAKKHGITPNPAQALEKRKVITEGFEPWTLEDIQQFLDFHVPGTKAHLAMLLFLEAAPRRSDLVNLGNKNIIDIDGRPHLKFFPQKTRHTSNIPVTIAMSTKLINALAHSPIGRETFLETEYGTPFTAKGFGNKFALWRDEAGVRPEVASHGIRKSVGINLAENDATPYEIMAALGHSSPKVTKIYTEAADRRKLSSKAATKATLVNLATEPSVDIEDG